MKIVVLGGGNSPEREVSLRSAKAVAQAGRKAGFDVSEIDPADGLRILDNLTQDTIILPILHGAGGEDGVIQAELEKRNIPFLGTGSLASARCFDKWETREILTGLGIPVPKAELVNIDTYRHNPMTDQQHVLKVVHGGSSIGTLVARDPKSISDGQIQEIFNLEPKAVLEELVEGIEITVPILDMSATPALEVRPPEGGEFDYENKYNGQSDELCPPPSLSSNQHRASQELAERVHKVMNCRHVSRVDTIMRPDGSFVVLEINTMPGMTNQSLYPKSAAVAGLTMTALVRKFVELVKRDYSI